MVVSVKFHTRIKEEGMREERERRETERQTDRQREREYRLGAEGGPVQRTLLR